jgi:hypothetical protein
MAQVAGLKEVPGEYIIESIGASNSALALANTAYKVT